MTRDTIHMSTNDKMKADKFASDKKADALKKAPPAQPKVIHTPAPLPVHNTDGTPVPR